MASLSVLKFNDPDGAAQVLGVLQELQDRQMITLEDAAVVSWPQAGRTPYSLKVTNWPGIVRSVARSGASCSG